MRANVARELTIPILATCWRFARERRSSSVLGRFTQPAAASTPTSRMSRGLSFGGGGRPVSSTLEGRRATRPGCLCCIGPPDHAFERACAAVVSLAVEGVGKAEAEKFVRLLRRQRRRRRPPEQVQGEGGAGARGRKPRASVRSTSRRWSACKWRCSRRSGPSPDRPPPPPTPMTTPSRADVVATRASTAPSAAPPSP